MIKIYLAGPLFSDAERKYNKELAENLIKEGNCEVFLPQELSQNIDLNYEDSSTLFNSLIEEIDVSDVVIAILNGADADSGTCIEMGYAYGIGKPIIGIRTDFRNLEIDGLNLMVLNICHKYFWFKERDITKKEITRKILDTIKTISLTLNLG